MRLISEKYVTKALFCFLLYIQHLLSGFMGWKPFILFDIYLTFITVLRWFEHAVILYIL